MTGPRAFLFWFFAAWLLLAAPILILNVIAEPERYLRWETIFAQRKANRLDQTALNAPANDRFQMRGFAERAHDGRFVTNQKNVANYPGAEDKPDVIATDANGFRIGRNRYDAQQPVIAFLGDSVSFGWSGAGSDSFPSLFYELLHQDRFSLKGRDFGVINAAIPSYTLRQAILRYEIEIENKFDVRLVVLQIYDPVTQFSRFGYKWTLDDNWSNMEMKAEQLRRSGDLVNLFMNNFSPYRIIQAIRGNVSDRALRFRPNAADDRVYAFFAKEIFNEVQAFRDRLAARGTRLIVLPIVPAYSGDLSARMNRAIVTVNQVFRELADNHSDVAFIDLEPVLRSVPPNEVFIDRCCHLNRFGGQMVAESILKRVLEQKWLELPQGQ